jgi:hypothetical protein
MTKEPRKAFDYLWRKDLLPMNIQPKHLGP